MLLLSNELIPEVHQLINTTPRCNVGNVKVDYRTMYTLEQIKMVEEATPLIKQFNYTF
jgi:predicted secreted Zn-dependent protease